MSNELVRVNRLNQMDNVKLVANLTKNLAFTHKFQAGDGTVFSYRLDLVSESPIVFNCSLESDRRKDGLRQGVPTIISTISVVNGKVEIDVKDEQSFAKPSQYKVEKINGVEELITKHSEVVGLKAIPDWVEKAKYSVEMNKIASIWLIVVNLSKLSISVVDSDNSIYKRTQFGNFSDRDWWEAVVISNYQCRNNDALQKWLTMMPTQYSDLLDDYIEPISSIEPSTSNTVVSLSTPATSETILVDTNISNEPITENVSTDVTTEVKPEKTARNTSKANSAASN